MANGIKYQAHEILNKVLNAAETGLQVDIVAGAEYAEDSGHTSTDTGNFVLGVRNDTLAALGGTDGDYVPFQMNASGALYVEIATGGGEDAVYVDDADWTNSSSKHMLVGGLYQSSPQSITDGDTGPLQVNANGNLIVDLSATDNAVLDAMVVDLAAMEVDLAAMEVLLTAANVDHAANEALLITIDEDTNAIKGHVDGIETLITSTNTKLDTLETTNNANQVLLGTIDSDTDATKTATESSNTHLGNMFYDTAIAVSPSDGSDLSGEPYFALFIGVGGNVKVDMSSGTGTVTLLNCASGQLLPLMVERVYSTGTTATNIIAFK